MIHRIYGLVTVLILVTSSGASAEHFTCPVPISIPDRWDDLSSDDTLDPGEPYDPALTGFRMPDDLGSLLVLEVASPLTPIMAGRYFAVTYPPLGGSESPLTGGDWLREWFRTCLPYIVNPEDSLMIEAGSMVGPIVQAMLDLIAQDPNAYWDQQDDMIVDSEHVLSPRVLVIPLFDPTLPPDSSRNDLHVVGFIKVFLESIGPGSQINTRIMDVSSEPTPTRRVTWSSLKVRYR